MIDETLFDPMNIQSISHTSCVTYRSAPLKQDSLLLIPYKNTISKNWPAMDGMVAGRCTKPDYCCQSQILFIFKGHGHWTTPESWKDDLLNYKKAQRSHL